MTTSCWKAQRDLPAALGTRADFEIRLKGRSTIASDWTPGSRSMRTSCDSPGCATSCRRGSRNPRPGRGRCAAVIAVKQGTVRRSFAQLGLRDVALQLPSRAVPPIEVVRVTEPRLELAPGNRIQLPTVTKEMIEQAPPPLPREARYAVLGGDFRLRREGDAWVFRAQELETQIGGRRGSPAASVWGRWSGHPVSTFALELNVDTLEVAPVWPLLLGFAPASFDRYAGLAPTGRVQALRLSAQRERAGLQPTFTARVELDGIGVQPIGRWPGRPASTLTLEGTDQGGQLQLRAQRTDLRLAAHVPATARPAASHGRRPVASDRRRVDCEHPGRRNRACQGSCASRSGACV